MIPTTIFDEIGKMSIHGTTSSQKRGELQENDMLLFPRVLKMHF